MKKPLLLLCFILSGTFVLAQKGFAVRAGWLNGINEIKLPSKELGRGYKFAASHYSFEEKIACRAEVLYRFPTGLFGKIGVEYRQYYLLNNNHYITQYPEPYLADVIRWNISYLGATAGLGYDHHINGYLRIYGSLTYHLLNKIWEKENYTIYVW